MQENRNMTLELWSNAQQCICICLQSQIGEMMLQIQLQLKLQLDFELRSKHAEGSNDWANWERELMLKVVSEGFKGAFANWEQNLHNIRCQNRHDWILWMKYLLFIWNVLKVHEINLLFSFLIANWLFLSQKKGWLSCSLKAENLE